MKNARIIGHGRYLPERVVTNTELEKMMDTSDEWIQERTGIKERHWIEPGETTIYELGYKATQKALESAGIEAGEIDLIVFASILSDYGFPGGGCLMQEMLGIPGVPSMDIRNACSGFIYGLSIGDKFVKTGTYKTVLIVGAEIQSTGIDKTTRGRDVAVIFGDGAGAVLLQATDDNNKGILTTHLHADGRFARKLWCEWPSIHRTPAMGGMFNDWERDAPRMEGRFVFKHAVVKFPEVINEALEATGYSIDDVDLLIPHQANLRISEAVGQRLGIPPNKIYNNIQRYGNTTAASIPIALDEAVEKGLIKENNLICLAAFGSGFTWGSALIRW